MCASSVEMTEAEIVNMEFDADTAIYKRASAMITVIKYDDTKKLYDSYGNAYYVIWHKYYGYTEIMHYDIERIKIEYTVKRQSIVTLGLAICILVPL